MKHEVFGESLTIALDGLIEPESSHLIHGSQRRIQHDFVAADHVNPAFHKLGRNRKLVRRCSNGFLFAFAPV